MQYVALAEIKKVPNVVKYIKLGDFARRSETVLLSPNSKSAMFIQENIIMHYARYVKKKNIKKKITFLKSD